VSDFRLRELALAPSRNCVRILHLCALGLLLASLLLFGLALRGLAPDPLTGLPAAASWLSALAPAASLAGAGAALHAAQREANRTVQIIRPGGWHALLVSCSRIVLRGPGRTVVVWNDATDPQSYRRLAALARWSASGRLP